MHQDLGASDGGPTGGNRGLAPFPEREADNVIRLPDVSLAQVAPREVKAGLDGALDAFATDLEPVLVEIWHRLERLDGYEDLTSREAERVRQALRHSILIFVRCLREEEVGAERQTFTVDDDAFYRRLGAERAWSGIPLVTLYEAFKVACRCAYVHLDRLAHLLPEPMGSEVSGLLQSRLIELFPDAWRRVKAGYKAARADGVLPSAYRQQALVDSLLDGRLDQGETADQLRRLNLPNPDRWCPLYVVAHERGAEALTAAVQALVATTPAVLSSSPRDEPAAHTIVLVNPPGFTSDVLECISAEHGVSLVKGRPARLHQLAHRCGPVRRHVALAGRLPDEPRVTDDRVLMGYALLIETRPEGVEWFCGSVLEPLLGANGVKARWNPLQSLSAILRCAGDLDAAAAACGLEKRTIQRHVKWLAEMLGVHRDVLLMDWRYSTALRLLRVHADVLPAPDDELWNQRYG